MIVLLPEIITKPITFEMEKNSWRDYVIWFLDFNFHSATNDEASYLSQ